MTKVSQRNALNYGMRVPWQMMLLLVWPFLADGQMLLKGRVMDSKSDTPLDGATVYNLSQRIYKKASFEGGFAIIAMSGDSIIFSSAGYQADTIAVSSDLLESGLDIGLKALPVVLDTVMVRSRSYSEDSAARRLEYKHFYDRRIHNITGGNTPSYGFGISVSPFSFFSRQERAKRKLRKQLRYNEEQAYVDFYFSSSYVHRLTGLSGQKLLLFMRKYRPSYKFVRKSDSQDLVNYINASLKAFRQSPEGR